MGKKMKNDEGLGKHLNEKYLQQIAPAEIKAVATWWFYWEQAVVVRKQVRSSLFFSCKAEYGNGQWNALDGEKKQTIDEVKLLLNCICMDLTALGN